MLTEIALIIRLLSLSVSAFKDAGGYDSHYDGFEDWHLWSRMVTKDNALVLNIVTTYYRLSERYKRGMTFRARLARVVV